MKIKHPMNNTNTNKEHLQYNDKEQNMKILFLTHAKILWNHTTHATHTIFWPTQLTPKLYEPTSPAPKFDPRHPPIHNIHDTYAI